MVRRLYGTSRLVLHDPPGNRYCSILFHKLVSCHDIPFEERLEANDPTIQLAELQRMQIVRIDKKDVRDTTMLFRDHEAEPSDKETINANRIARLSSVEWSLWKTATTNLKRVVQSAKVERVIG